MKIEKDDNLPSGYRILGSGNCWDIEEDKISILVSDIEIIPMSGNDMYVTAYGPGSRQIAEDIIELSREIGREELDTLKAENESLKETIEVLQRQLEKERSKNAVKSEVVQNIQERTQHDVNDIETLHIIGKELYASTKFIVARYNETVRENERLRKRNKKLQQDFESIKGHLRVAQHTIDEYRRKSKHYSEMFVANHPGQSLTFKDAKVSVSDNGDVTVSGKSVENLIHRLKQLCETEEKVKAWQDIVLKNIEVTPDIFNEHIKEN